MIAQVGDFLKKLAEINEQLMGAPAGVLLFICTIGVGAALKSWHRVPNHKIPGYLMAGGCIVWFCNAPYKVGEDLRLWIGRNVLIGLIIPCAAWMFHRVVLKRVERKFNLFANKGFDTGFAEKSETATSTKE